jgi:uncharacterized membrane protein
MEALLKEFAVAIALGAEFIGILIVALGAFEALIGTMRTIVPAGNRHSRKKEVWRRFGTWLLLGLEFELAADIVRSAIAPTWLDIGELGAIAVIRTFLNYFLEKDLEHASDSERAAAAADSASARLGEAA